MNLFNYYGRSVTDNDLINDIEKAINDEFSSFAYFEKLAKLAPNETVSNQLLEISNDETKHFQIFSNLYTSLTGKQPNPIMTKECPNVYEEGLDSSFNSKQKTVDFYLEIADRSSDVYIKDQFKRAAADEQNHAVWFLYYLTRYNSSF